MIVTAETEAVNCPQPRHEMCATPAKQSVPVCNGCVLTCTSTPPRLPTTETQTRLT